MTKSGSPACDFVYEGETNRIVAVHKAGMTEVLKKLYNAPALVKELLGQ
ncbi:MAG TPA: S46 family peptidase [Candidatus Acidoferrales bacterium]|nr:S46 family peptidase [Candidatus Acidoferrales bacterium]